MDKSLFIYIIFGMLFLYSVTSFTDIMHDDKNYSEKKYEKYQYEDTVGDSILNVSMLSFDEQLEVWHNSPLRDEFMALFPKFSEMKAYIRDRVVATELSDKLIADVDKAEDKYFSGELTADETKQMLSF